MERKKRVEIKVPLNFHIGVVCREDQDPLAWLREYVERQPRTIEFEWSFKGALACGRLESLELDRAVILSQKVEEEEKGD